MNTEDGLRSSGYWQQRSHEALAMAEQMADPVAKALMQDIAHKYELMAQRAARRETMPTSGG
jgi:hypothetical protein